MGESGSYRRYFFVLVIDPEETDAVLDLVAVVRSDVEVREEIVVFPRNVLPMAVQLVYTPALSAVPTCSYYFSFSTLSAARVRTMRISHEFMSTSLQFIFSAAKIFSSQPQWTAGPCSSLGRCSRRPRRCLAENRVQRLRRSSPMPPPTTCPRISAGILNSEIARLELEPTDASS